VAAVAHVVAAKRQIYHRGDLADQFDLEAATLSSRVHNDTVNKASNLFKGRSTIAVSIERLMQASHAVPIDLAEVRDRGPFCVPIDT
jgi:hypothetical protein